MTVEIKPKEIRISLWQRIRRFLDISDPDYWARQDLAELVNDAKKTTGFDDTITFGKDKYQITSDGFGVQINPLDKKYDS